MSNAQKTPFSRAMTLYINQMIRKFLDRLAKGRPATLVSLDASGTIATVNFEIAGIQLPQVTMPVAGSEYIRLPLQPGCKGLCIPSDFYLGAMSGLGSGTADTTPRGTLSTLVFFPIGNKNFSATDDPQSTVIYGPNGAIIRDAGGNCEIQVSPTNIRVVAADDIIVSGGTQISVTVGGSNITIDGSTIVLTVGVGTLTLTAGTLVSSVPISAPDISAAGQITAGTSLKVAGVEMSGHTHDVVGVQTGASTIVTGPPL